MDLRRLVVIVPLLLSSSCASGSGIPETRTDRSIVSVNAGAGESQLELTRNAAISSDVLPIGAEEIWARVPAVYEALGLPITGLDPEARIVGTVQRVKRIAGKSIASYLNCPGAYGNLAGSGDVYLTVRTQVIPTGGSAATVRHEVGAVARSSTSGMSRVMCASNGSLEKLLTSSLAGGD